ncbi:MAG: glycosyltransferase family 2 protein [Solirubrobacteraceae bacterium]
MNELVAGGGKASPQVSVCVVTFRDRENLLRCLESIVEHADVSHEVIIVDDASHDGTIPAVRRRFPNLKLIERAQNGGLVAGRNDALPHAIGRFVLMLDSDTELRPHSLSRLVRVLEGNPEVGLVGPRLVGVDGELQLSCRRYPPLLIPLMRRGPYARLVPSPRLHRWHLMMDFDHQAQRSVAWVSGAAQMWRRELVPILGAYDHRVSSYGGEDLDWCLRVWAAGFKVRYVPEAEVMHIGQQMTRRSLYGRSSFRALRDWYYLQFKHWRLRRAPRMSEANA